MTYKTRFTSSSWRLGLKLQAITNEFSPINASFRFCPPIRQRVWKLFLKFLIEMKTLSKRDFLLNEIPTPDSKYLDEPEEFINVKDVPAIFTINKHNFTEHNLQECNCTQLSIEGKEMFKKTEMSHQEKNWSKIKTIQSLQNLVSYHL